MQRKEKERSISLQKDSENQVKGKVVPTSFLKKVGRGPFVRAEERRKRNRGDSQNSDGEG